MENNSQKTQGFCRNHSFCGLVVVSQLNIFCKRLVFMPTILLVAGAGTKHAVIAV